jgi:hypothetical protein
LFFKRHLPNDVHVNISTLDSTYVGVLARSKDNLLFVKNVLSFNREVTLMLDCIFYKYDLVSVIKDQDFLKVYKENLDLTKIEDNKEDNFIYRKGDYVVIVVDDSYFFGQVISNNKTTIYMKDVLQYKFEGSILKFWLFKEHLANVVFNKKFITLTSKEDPTSEFTNQYLEALTQFKTFGESSDYYPSRDDIVIVCTDSLDVIATVIDNHNFEGLYSHTIVNSQIQLWSFRHNFYVVDYKYLIVVSGNKELEKFVEEYQYNNVLKFTRSIE